MPGLVYCYTCTTRIQLFPYVVPRGFSDIQIGPISLSDKENADRSSVYSIETQLRIERCKYQCICSIDE